MRLVADESRPGLWRVYNAAGSEVAHGHLEIPTLPEGRMRSVAVTFVPDKIAGPSSPWDEPSDTGQPDGPDLNARMS